MRQQTARSCSSRTTRTTSISTLRALKKNNIGNEIVVARDGAEALDYLFGTGRTPARGVTSCPQVVCWISSCRASTGSRCCADPRRRAHAGCSPVVVLTSSDERRGHRRSYSLGANSYVRKPVDFGEFLEAARQLGLYWLVLNQAPPRPV